MSNPADVIVSVMAALNDDATLIGLVPDGAFLNVSPGGVTKAVIVSLVTHEDAYAMRQRGHEKFLVLVKAVERSTSVDGVNAAAARIDALLQAVELTITGYSHMVTLREEHISYAEVDEDKDEHWQHAGGRYAIWAAPNN